MIEAGLLYLGLFALAASMSRHAAMLPGRIAAPHHAAWARRGGWALLLLSLAIPFARTDWPMALLTWFGLAPVMAGVVLIGLTYGVVLTRIAAGAALLAVLAGCIA